MITAIFGIVSQYAIAKSSIPSEYAYGYHTAHTCWYVSFGETLVSSKTVNEISATDIGPFHHTSVISRMIDGCEVSYSVPRKVWS